MACVFFSSYCVVWRGTRCVRLTSATKVAYDTYVSCVSCDNKSLVLVRGFVHIFPLLASSNREGSLSGVERARCRFEVVIVLNATHVVCPHTSSSSVSSIETYQEQFYLRKTSICSAASLKTV